MKESIYICDQCKKPTNDRVSIRASDNFLVHIKKEEDEKIFHFPKSLDFCSLTCFIDYLMEKRDRV